MKTTITIKNIRVSCILGVTEKERKSLQEIGITIQLGIDSKKASKTDDINDSVNYREVYENVLAVIAHSQFHLLEKLGDAVADMCLQYAGVKSVTVTIAKFNRLKKADYVAVEIQKDNE